MTFDLSRLIKSPAPRGSRRRPGLAVDPGVRFIVAHDTANPGARAAAHARWYQSDPNPDADHISSAHLFADDLGIVETIPAFEAAEQARHVLYRVPTDNQLYGYDANRAAIGVEYCFGGKIDRDKAYANYVWALAALCDFHKLDPSRAIVGHHMLDPGRKSDPVSGLKAGGLTYEQLLNDVVLAYRQSGGGTERIGSARISSGNAVTTVNLRRRSRPGLSAETLEILAPGTAVEVVGVEPGERVSGNADWCLLAGGGYVWSGGVKATSGGSASPLAPPDLLDAASASAAKVDSAIALAEAEWAFFGHQTYPGFNLQSVVGHKESEAAPYWERIGSYWRAAHQPDWDGRVAQPWSAAFISWVMTGAGFVPKIKASASHADYIYRSILDRDKVIDAAYWGYRLNERRPRRGDLVCRTRDNQGVSFDNQLQGNYRSHTDLVVAVASDHIEVIGGNVGNSVTRRPFPLDADGYLSPEGPINDHFFAIMGCRIE